jgi:hypothetical protein
MSRRLKRKDANHSACTEAVRAVGAVTIDCTGDPSIGFDEIWLWRGQTFLIEIKDGSKPASRRRLTPNERQRHADAARVDVTIHIIETTDQALQLIGAVEV